MVEVSSLTASRKKLFLSLVVLLPMLLSCLSEGRGSKSLCVGWVESFMMRRALPLDRAVYRSEVVVRLLPIVFCATFTNHCFLRMLQPFVGGAPVEVLCARLGTYCKAGDHFHSLSTNVSLLKSTTVSLVFFTIMQRLLFLHHFISCFRWWKLRRSPGRAGVRMSYRSLGGWAAALQPLLSKEPLCPLFCRKKGLGAFFFLFIHHPQNDSFR